MAPILVAFVFVILSAALGQAQSSGAITVGTTSANTKCLEVVGSSPGNGAAVQINTCSINSAKQTWQFVTATVSGKTVLRTTNNLCLDVPDGVGADAKNMQVWTCDRGNRNQFFNRDGNNLRWSDSTYCLNIPNGVSSNFAVGKQLQLFTCNLSGNNQKLIGPASSSGLVTSTTARSTSTTARSTSTSARSTSTSTRSTSSSTRSSSSSARSSSTSARSSSTTTRSTSTTPRTTTTTSLTTASRTTTTTTTLPPTTTSRTTTSTTTRTTTTITTTTPKLSSTTPKLTSTTPKLTSTTPKTSSTSTKLSSSSTTPTSTSTTTKLSTTTSTTTTTTTPASTKRTTSTRTTVTTTTAQTVTTTTAQTITSTSTVTTTLATTIPYPSSTTKPALASIFPSTAKRMLAWGIDDRLASGIGAGSQISLYHHWELGVVKQMPAKNTYLPTFWGPTKSSYWDTARAAFGTQMPPVILGFNEPDVTGQANMTPAAAAQLMYDALWVPYGSRGANLVSPAIAWDVNKWLVPFMKAYTNLGGQVDAIGYHIYLDLNNNTDAAVAEVEKRINTLYALFGKKIVLSELGLTQAGGGTDEQINDFVQKVGKFLDNSDAILGWALSAVFARGNGWDTYLNSNMSFYYSNNTLTPLALSYMSEAY